MVWWLALIMAVLAGALFTAARELHEHSRDNLWPMHMEAWWNTRTSWKNKWRYRHGELTGPYYHWWYGSLFRTRHQEAFPFSSTLLVWLTDGEHLFQMLMTLAVLAIAVLATATGTWWVPAGVLAGMMGFGAIKEMIIENLV